MVGRDEEKEERKWSNTILILRPIIFSLAYEDQAPHTYVDHKNFINKVKYFFCALEFPFYI